MARLWRAQRAAEIDRVEERRPDFFAGKWDPTPPEWRIILDDDDLMAAND